MNTLWSQTEEALRDTLVHKAEGEAFERITRFHGFAWPKFIAEAAWRGGFKAVAYNARDTFSVVFDALTKCLAGYIETFDDCYYPVGFFTGVSRAGGWSEAYIGRYIRIGTTVYYSAGISGVKLLLSPYTTSYWTGADNTLNVLAQSPIDLVEVLPFMLYERGNGPSYVDPNLNGDEGDSWQGQTYSWFLTNTLEVEVWPHVASVPGSYLWEPEDYALASEGTCPAVDGGDPGVCTPSTVPNGGYLLYSDALEVDTFVDGAAVTPVGLFNLNVDRTDGFTASGTIRVDTATGWTVIQYASKTSTTFQNCTGEEGVALSDGAKVVQANADYMDDIADAYPIYLCDGVVSRELEYQFGGLLPAGNHVNMYATERSWPEVP